LAAWPAALATCAGVLRRPSALSTERSPSPHLRSRKRVVPWRLHEIPRLRIGRFRL
jgi:hypothetical protein